MCVQVEEGCGVHSDEEGEVRTVVRMSWPHAVVLAVLVAGVDEVASVAATGPAVVINSATAAFIHSASQPVNQLTS